MKVINRDTKIDYTEDSNTQKDEANPFIWGLRSRTVKSYSKQPHHKATAYDTYLRYGLRTLRNSMLGKFTRKD